MTRKQGLDGLFQRLVIRSIESVAEAATIYGLERLDGRRPRDARGYLRPLDGAFFARHVLLAMTERWLADLAQKAEEVAVQIAGGTTLRCYATLEKCERLRLTGMQANSSYLTSMRSDDAARVCEDLALPGDPDHAIEVTFCLPVEAVRRPVASDFGRWGGGTEILLKQDVPAWALRFSPPQRLRPSASPNRGVAS